LSARLAGLGVRFGRASPFFDGYGCYCDGYYDSGYDCAVDDEVWGCFVATVGGGA